MAIDVKFTNNARTLLSTSSVSTSATSISVDDGSVFPSLSGSSYFYATLQRASDSTAREIVKVTARSSNDLTIVRAQDNTSALTFAADDIIELRVVAKAFEDIITDVALKSTASATETLTNKTFDVEGTGNSISNIDVADLKSGVLDTDISSVSGSDDTLASAKAVKTYVDAQIATKDNTDEITEGSSNLYFTNARADARITNALKDEDDMASDSATHVPSQQSVKAYVDAQDAAIASDTLTFTNKTFDVEGTGNSISNIDVADLKSGVLDTDISSVSGSDDTLASAKAIKTYIDDNSGGVTRNYILNPEFAYSQRGTTINSTTPTSGSNSDSIAIIDMYRILSDGDDIVDIAQTQTDVPTGSKTAIELQVETANKKFGIVQFIENVNCESIIGQEVTLSFQAKATSDLDDVRAAIIAWDGTEDAPTADIVDAWNVEGTNPTLKTNFTYENTPSNLSVGTSFSKHSVTATIDTSGTKNVAVFIWSNVTGTTAADDGSEDKLHIGQIQLERGSSASDFVFPEFSAVMESCRRYLHFQVSNGGTTQDNGVIGHGHFFTTAARLGIQLTTPMRVAPTVTGSGVNYIGASSGTATSFASILSIGANITTMSFNIGYSTNSSMFTGSSGYITSGGGFFIMTAELGA